MHRFGMGLAGQRGHLAEWVPVCLAVGIGAYFAIDLEPRPRAVALLVMVALAVLGVGFRVHENFRPFFTAAFLVAAGFAIATARAHIVEGPVLQYRYYGPIEGQVVRIDRSQSDALRLTLRDVVLARHERAETPTHVRVSLHSALGLTDPAPGQVVMMTGHLSPPSGPVEPGGFDFQRQAWFSRLGAVGYTRNPVVLWEDADPGAPDFFVARTRARISRAVSEHMGGQVGAFAAAVTTGDRSGMDRDIIEQLRGANLSHLLAISGLHMGLLTSFVFALVRLALALMPRAGRVTDSKPAAAIAALLAAVAYLMLSGGNVATIRAFVMVAVMLLAILLGRRALTLRSVAVAATLILILRPEALTGPGFQMSFAATTVLVFVFAGLSGDRWRRVPRPLRPVLAVVISSAAAGLATAPVAAAHFNRIADYGLLANIAAVPVMGLLVMPGAVMAAVLSVVGLADIGLWVMGIGIRWVLAVAGFVSNLSGAQSYVVAPGPVVLPLMAGGALFAILWQGRLRVRALGILPMIAALWLWSGTDRPDLLVADTGGLIGVMTEEGRALSKPRGDGFAALSWLENDGDGADQTEAAARAGFVSEEGATLTWLGDTSFAHIVGRGGTARAEAACARYDVVVTTAKRAEDAGGCLMLDPKRLRDTGAVRFDQMADGVRMITTRAVSGRRLWN